MTTKYIQIASFVVKEAYPTEAEAHVVPHVDTTCLLAQCRFYRAIAL